MGRRGDARAMAALRTMAELLTEKELE